MPVSAAQQAKRALAAVINALAGRYGVAVHISRDSPDADLRSAYRQVSLRVHPDRSGHGEDQKRLNAAHDAWAQAVTAPKGRGRPHAARCGGADAGGNDAMTMLLPTEQGQPRQEQVIHGLLLNTKSIHSICGRDACVRAMTKSRIAAPKVP